MSSNYRDLLNNKWPFNESSMDNFVFLTSIPEKKATFCDIPDTIHPELKKALYSSGISHLYTHQALAWNNYRVGKDQVIVTGTASGKSLCYQIPALDNVLTSPGSKSLFIFPTKALAQDQLNSINNFSSIIAANGETVHGFVYDGDTPSGKRKNIREFAEIVITNPDMLHFGILPRHNYWASFFSNLRLVVIDEIHIYRGVFGSHVANVIRRLNRICDHYDCKPLFILTSATISNAREHANALLDSNEVELVNEDGSGRSERVFGIYNPPIVNKELGLRNSAIFESLDLIDPLIHANFQTIVFGRARKTIELIYHYYQKYFPDLSNLLTSYRAGYLPSTRRSIESALRDGKYKGVITTNALEVGINIGSMDVSISVGYPGTIASTVQQMGRAGRQNRKALSILMTTNNPLDQYLATHPEYFLGLSPEKAYIDPNHLLILLQHILFAAYELPFYKPFVYGSLDEKRIHQFLSFFTSIGQLVETGNSYHWAASGYPARGSTLRNASGDVVLLRTPENVIGTVDLTSSYWMVHPGAIYFHQGDTFLVRDLNIENRVAILEECNEDYQTQPIQTIEIINLNHITNRKKQAGFLSFDHLQVNTQVTGFKKIKMFTHEVLDTQRLDMPVTELRTAGLSHVINHETVDQLRQQRLWLSDSNDYGPDWSEIRFEVRTRDQFRCRNCGLLEDNLQHHVHHKIPFKLFSNPIEANQLENLITLCSACHKQAETNVRVRSGLSGLAYAIRSLAPLYLMCDSGDIEVLCEPQSKNFDSKPAIILYDTIPGGIGLSRGAYDRWDEILTTANEVISRCSCSSGCPSCVGPAGEEGYGGKEEAVALLDWMIR